MNKKIRKKHQNKSNGKGASKPQPNRAPNNQLGIAKSIAARFGEEIWEDEFYDEPEAKPVDVDVRRPDGGTLA